MKIAGYEFRPSLWPALATLCLLPVFLSLGNWQLSRADEKRQLQQQQREQLQAETLSLTAKQGLRDLSANVFRKVIIQGEYLDRHYLLDNQIYQGRVGYDVYSLLDVAHSESLMLVNRGWVAMHGDRRVLPSIETPAGSHELSGILSKTPGELLQLVDYDTDAANWPRVVQQIDVQRIARQIGRPVSQYVIQLDEGQPGAYSLHWKPYVDTPDKHVSYAVQWFSMAVVLVFLFFWLNLRRPKRE